MIQRIQTVFLFLVMVALTIMLFFPLWQKQSPDTGEMAKLTALSLQYVKSGQAVQQKNTIYLALLAAIGIVLAGISIFSYKNRMAQVRFNLINALVLTIIMLVMVYTSFEGEKFFAITQRGNFGFGFYMPAAALFFNALANRFIRRDENLVRSMNRMR